MLVEFSVKNFRSICDEQRLSMVASAAREHEASHVFDCGAPGVGRLLLSAVLYGANAAGKSNFLRALSTVERIVLNSAKESQQGENLEISPFEANSDNKPSVFEVVFVQQKVKYQFGFSASNERILEEWLYAFPEGKAQKWYYRTERDGKTEYEYGSFLKGHKRQWESATRSNSLFLSTAVQLNSGQLALVFQWFKETLRMVLGKG